MKDRPILFNGEMVRAVLDGRKTQTRRVITKWTGKKIHVGNNANQNGYCTVKNHSICRVPWTANLIEGLISCPYGQVGDQLWVRENFKFYEFPVSGKDVVEYAAGGIKNFPNIPDPFEGLKVNKFDKNYSSIFMPRWASRIDLEITDIRVERVQEISEESAKTEGAELYNNYDGTLGGWGAPEKYKDAFRLLWDSINE